MRLERGGVHRVPPDDPVAEAGREPLDLRLDAIRHVDGRSVRHVAVGPRRVRAGRRPARVEQARLREQHERALGETTALHVALRRGDLVERAAEVDGRRPLQSSFVHGIGPSSAQSTLNTPGP